MQDINDNLVKITELLNDQQYHDGTSIGNQLNITRAAVWKAIKKLEQYQVEINSIKGKGYRLQEPLILLNSHKIKSYLSKKSAPQIKVLEKTGSTNEYLKKLAITDPKTTVCLAEMQTQPKARMNRSWHSPFGKNIYLSIAHRFQKDISELSGLSLVIGLAVCHALNKHCQLNPPLSVKWPNDCIIDGQKIAGNLIEIQAESNGHCHAIIGVGVNVNMQHATREHINQAWSSLQKVSGHYQDRNKIAAALIQTISDYLTRFEDDGITTFIEEWKAHDYLYNREINLVTQQKKISGMGAGINEQGHLLLKMKDGATKAFSSGDTTISK